MKSPITKSLCAQTAVNKKVITDLPVKNKF